MAIYLKLKTQGTWVSYTLGSVGFGPVADLHQGYLEPPFGALRIGSCLHAFPSQLINYPAGLQLLGTDLEDVWGGHAKDIFKCS